MNKFSDEQFLDAVIAGDVKVIQDLLRGGANVNCVGQHGETPLMIAAYAGYLEVAKILVKAGANINAADHLGWTPLISSLQGKSHKIAKALVKLNANVLAKDKNGGSALEMAKEMQLTDLVALMESKLLDDSVKDTSR